MKASKAALKIALVATVCFTLADSAKATIAYQNPTGTYGNATGDGRYNVGMDFTVGGAGIIVTSLGAFDNGQDGLAAPITVAIYRVSDQSMMTSVNFGAGNSGTLIGGSRFLDITDIILGAGTYRIVAGGYGGDISGRERLFTEEIPNSITIPTDTGGGLIAYPLSGGNYYSPFTGAIGFPTILSGSATVPGYAGGTFDFTPVPEASQFAVAGVGLLGLVYIGRCAWQRRKVVA
jgi:hypothetical protein